MILGCVDPSWVCKPPADSLELALKANPVAFPAHQEPLEAGGRAQLAPEDSVGGAAADSAADVAGASVVQEVSAAIAREVTVDLSVIGRIAAARAFTATSRSNGRVLPPTPRISR